MREEPSGKASGGAAGIRRNKRRRIGRRSWRRWSLSGARAVGRAPSAGGLFQDLADPELYVGTFTVATWQEHLRQHLERGTEGDRAFEERAGALTVDQAGPRVRHLMYGYVRRTPRHDRHTTGRSTGTPGPLQPTFGAVSHPGGVRLRG